ncbi:hypothetical protein HYZ70_02375 [Candidatus Curtissbacteria bacterium]|nr:hypothetical protein [Candidatus Curtissbacteria bacterium]
MAEVEKVEISILAYRYYLEGLLANLQNKENEIKGLLAALDTAVDRNLIIRCYESQEGVKMETKEKGQMGFTTRE